MRQLSIQIGNSDSRLIHRTESFVSSASSAVGATSDRICHLHSHSAHLASSAISAGTSLQPCAEQQGVVQAAANADQFILIELRPAAAAAVDRSWRLPLECDRRHVPVRFPPLSKAAFPPSDRTDHHPVRRAAPAAPPPAAPPPAAAAATTSGTQRTTQ